MRTRTSPSRAPERLAALVVLLGCASASLAWAGPEQQAEGSAEPRIDAWGPIESLDDRVLLTSEPSRARLAERPVGPWRVRCARERPVCVHARDSVGEAALERVEEIAALIAAEFPGACRARDVLFSAGILKKTGLRIGG